MRITIVNNLYPPNRIGGAERSVQLLAEELVRAGVKVTVICADRVARGAVEINGVRVITLAAANVDWPFGRPAAAAPRRWIWHALDVHNQAMRRRLEWVLRAERPDLVHTNNLQGITVSAWRAAERCGVPVLHTLRDYYLACTRATLFRAGRDCVRPCAGCAIFRTARRRASSVVAGVVGVSRFTLDRHLDLDFFPRAKLRAVVTNPAMRFGRSDRGLGLRFGFLGRLEPNKGLDELLRVFARLDGEGWELLIAGNGRDDYIRALRKRAARALRPDRISFLGWVDNTELMAQLDVVIVPSLWQEPASRTAIEAQAGGVAVIASRRGGLPEIVDDGATGWLFDPADPDGLARIIDLLLHRPELAAKCGAAAAAAAGRFAPQAVAESYRRIYSELTIGWP